jgi:endoglycosylceramidase
VVEEARGGRLLIVAAMVAVGVLLAVPATSPAARPHGSKAAERAAPVGPLANSGRWITDARGRVVILHGINMVAKRPPYEPGALGFSRDDARFLARNGFNTVRLGMIYGAVEPQPGEYDDSYIGSSRFLERMLARQGIFSLVDFHQDLYNERFGGEGWPEWATLDDGLSAEPKPGFPATYISSPGLNRSFDNFWANAAGPGGVGIQDRYASAWAHVARAFRRDDGVLGYDLLNEPWPGSDFPTCASTAGCPAFDQAKLATMSRRMITAIRGVERRHIVFYEPNVLFNFDVATNLPDLGSNLGFSFHDYCLTGVIQGAPAGCPEAEGLVFDNADAHAERRGDSLLLSEFGATDDLETLQRITGFADEHMVSWQEWHYCGCDDPTTSGPGDVQALVKDPSLPPTGENVFRDKLEALARPYPQVVAGTPERFAFDPATKRFGLAYTPRRADGHGRFRRGRTLVFLPRIQYPDGYRVRVEGGSIEGGSRGRRLVLRADRRSSRVTLTVTPR